MGLATGAAEKGVLQVYERVFRPEEKRHQPWVERCRTQMSGSLSAIDRHLGERGVSQWLVGKRMTQADITAVCVFTFLSDALRVAADSVMFQSLSTLAARCESIPVFQETRVPFRVCAECLESADTRQLPANRELVYCLGALVCDHALEVESMTDGHVFGAYP